MNNAKRFGMEGGGGMELSKHDSSIRHPRVHVPEQRRACTHVRRGAAARAISRRPGHPPLQVTHILTRGPYSGWMRKPLARPMESKVGASRLPANVPEMSCCT